MKKISIGFLTLCTLLMMAALPACAGGVEAGVGVQQNNHSWSGALKLGCRITEQWEIRGIYDSGAQVLAPGIVYFPNPAAPVAPYLGVESGPKTKVVAGLECDTSKWIPSTAVAVEIKTAPGDMANTTAFSITFNYRLPFPGAGTAGAKGNQYLLAQLITAEAGAEPYEGQVAAGAVVVNRTKTPLFPNTVPKVIYEPTQFKSAGKLRTVKPSATALQAAKDALAGRDPSNGALYFYNPATASPQGLRFFSRLKVTARIGNHVFAK